MDRSASKDRSRLARNTGSMLVAQLGRAAIQGLYFVLISRSLGAEGLGAFAAVAALVALVSPFSGWGGGNILVQEGALDETSIRVHWGNALLSILVSGSLLVLLATLLGMIFLPRPITASLIVLVAFADLFFYRAVELSSQAYQAVERLERTAQLLLQLNGWRLLAAVTMYLWVDSPSPTQWAGLYLLATLIGGVVAYRAISRSFGAPRIDLALARTRFRLGFLFSVGLASQNAYNDIDKSMLAALANVQAAGIYTAAYRVIDLAFSPVRSFLFATYARFFRSGAEGIGAGFSLAKRWLPWAVVYGALAGVAIYLVAPLLPVILGPDYAESVSAVRWLAILPLLRTTHVFAADTLTGAGHQGLRSVVQVGVFVFNICANLVLIPRYSWKGAAWSSLASEALLIFALWGLLGWRLRHGSRSPLSAQA